MSNYTNFLAMLSTEFQRYLIENDEFSGKIPVNAMVIFQVAGEDDFNDWHRAISLKNRENDQPVIYVYVKKWREHSLIEALNVTEAAA